MEFDPIDKDTGEKHDFCDETGQYVTKDGDKFGTWVSDYEAGFVCHSCGLSIWYFT